jgi:phage terminase small subunit
MSGSRIQSSSAPLEAAEKVKAEIATLQEMLEARAPGYETLLQRIHRSLREDDTLAHLLSDEEVGIVLSGLARKTNTVIATTPSKSVTTAGGVRKKLKDLTADDLT